MIYSTKWQVSSRFLWNKTLSGSEMSDVSQNLSGCTAWKWGAKLKSSVNQYVQSCAVAGRLSWGITQLSAGVAAWSMRGDAVKLSCSCWKLVCSVWGGCQRPNPMCGAAQTLRAVSSAVGQSRALPCPALCREAVGCPSASYHQLQATCVPCCMWVFSPAAAVGAGHTAPEAFITSAWNTAWKKHLGDFCSCMVSLHAAR